MMRESRERQRDIVADILERAFMHVGDNGRLYANARQLMYACRDEIQQRSGKKLDDNYFTQTLLPGYLQKFRPPWADKVAYDDRGHLREPHTPKMSVESELFVGVSLQLQQLLARHDGKKQICPCTEQWRSNRAR
jgi:hypothetical protein